MGFSWRGWTGRMGEKYDKGGKESWFAFSRLLCRCAIAKRLLKFLTVYKYVQRAMPLDEEKKKIGREKNYTI